MSYEKVTLKKIEDLRHQLVKSASVYGFTSVETIKVSQRLDSLLNTYSNITKKSTYFTGEY